MLASKKIAIISLLVLTCLALAFGTAMAADYPSKPVTMIVAYAPGGSTDTLARVTAKYLEEELGQPFVVTNKSGSGGDIGFTAIAKAQPDGYTIGLINVSPVIVNPITRPKVVRYRIEDFAPIANVVTDPGIICVSSDSKFDNLEEFVAYAKENPGQISISHEGKGGGDHLGVLAFEKEAGITLNGVPFDGDAPAKAALMGGHIDAIAVNVSEVADMIQNGQLRGLAVENSKRSQEVPDVPTFKEYGYNVLQASSRGFAAPNGVAQDKLDILIEAMTKIKNNPEYLAELKKLNMPLDFMAGEEYGAFLEEQHEFWKGLWEADPWIE
jgi:tripartite-type tricarboxylate transporter receptor subunit TctC